MSLRAFSRLRSSLVPLLYRRAELDDAAGLADLAALTFPLACPPSLDREAVAAFISSNLSTESFQQYLADRSHRVIAGVDDDRKIRAYALLVRGTAMDEDCAPMIRARPTIGISKFYLDPTLHGSGEATRMLDAVIEVAESEAARSLWLATNIANARARGFYTRTGFIERGERDFLVGGVPNRDVVFERPLPSPGQPPTVSKRDSASSRDVARRYFLR